MAMAETTQTQTQAQPQTAEQKPRLPKTVPGGYIHAVGRRKESVARVYLKPGEGKIIVNGKPADLGIPATRGWSSARSTASTRPGAPSSTASVKLS